MTNREYNSVHQWRLRNRTKKGVCENCKNKSKTQWSNKSGAYVRDDDSDWQELCPRCHNRYDVEVLKKNRSCSTGKQWSKSYKEALPRLRTYPWFKES